MPAAEGDWSLEVTLRGTTFGTEAQARETAERWRKLVAVTTGGDIELASVDVVAVTKVEKPSPRQRRTRFLDADGGPG